MAAIDRSVRIDRRETSWQIDFRALDRRERLIMSGMPAGLALGMVLALAGESLARALPGDVVAAYDPYLYGALILGVTRGSPQAGWAALNGALTAAGLAAGRFTAYGLDHTETMLGQTGGWKAALGVTIVAFGLVGYLSRRPNVGGDIAVGLFSGMLLLTLIVQRAADPPHASGPWMPVTLLALGLSAPLLLRPSAAARTRAALTAATCTAASAAPLFLPLLLPGLP